MQIKKWLKGKYWLWGILFSLVLVESAGIYYDFNASFPRWDYRYAFWFGLFPYGIVFGVISELFFRTLKKFKACSLNTFPRILFLICLILLSLFFILGVFAAIIFPFLD